MNYTTNYNLNKPEGTDLYNHLTIDNPNMDTIDAAMYANKLQAIGSATELVSGTVHAITRGSADQNIFKFKATGNFNAGDTITVDGVTVTAYLTSGQSLPDNAYIISSEVVCILDGTSLWVLVNAIAEASEIPFDNTGTTLTSTNVKDAIVETMAPRLVLSIPANTYATWALALAAVEATYSALSAGEKKKTALVLGDTAVLHVDNLNGSFTRSRTVAANSVVQTLSLVDHTYYACTMETIGNSIVNSSASAQSSKLDLYVL